MEESIGEHGTKTRHLWKEALHHDAMPALTRSMLFHDVSPGFPYPPLLGGIKAHIRFIEESCIDAFVR